MLSEKHLQTVSTNRLVTGEAPFQKHSLNLTCLCKFWIDVINLSPLANVVSSKLHLPTVSCRMHPIRRPVSYCYTVSYREAC